MFFKHQAYFLFQFYSYFKNLNFNNIKKIFLTKKPYEINECQNVLIVVLAQRSFCCIHEEGKGGQHPGPKHDFSWLVSFSEFYFSFLL